MLVSEDRNLYLMDVHGARQDAWFFFFACFYLPRIFKEAWATPQEFEWRIFKGSSYSVDLMGQMRKADTLHFSVLVVS